MNELICKFIYVNLRFTVELKEETGVTIDYVAQSRHFPAPDEPLLKGKRAAQLSIGIKVRGGQMSRPLSIPVKAKYKTASYA